MNIFIYSIYLFKNTNRGKIYALSKLSILIIYAILLPLTQTQSWE